MTLVTSTATVTLTRLIGFVKTLTVLVTSIVTISEVVVHYITLTAVSTVTATISKLLNILLTISVNCGIILSRLINVTITAVSTIIQVLLVNYVSFTNYPLSRLMYAAQKFRTVSAAKLRKIFY
jgi:hypothetical protein